MCKSHEMVSSGSEGSVGPRASAVQLSKRYESIKWQKLQRRQVNCTVDRTPAFTATHSMCHQQLFFTTRT